MISEGLVTSIDSRGGVHFSPLGPVVDHDYRELLLRPFQPSTSFNNLSARRCGVFHIVDDVELITRCVTHTLQVPPAVTAATSIEGWVLKDCCRWLEFRVLSVDSSEPRSRMQAEVTHRGERRAFWGYNRARHAILELCILATRTQFLPAEDIRAAFRYFEPVIQRTAGTSEFTCLELLAEYLESRLQGGLHE